MDSDLRTVVRVVVIDGRPYALLDCNHKYRLGRATDVSALPKMIRCQSCTNRASYSSRLLRHRAAPSDPAAAKNHLNPAQRWCR